MLITSHHRAKYKIICNNSRCAKANTVKYKTEFVICSYYLHSNATVADFLDPAVFDSLRIAINKVKHAVKGSGPCSFWISKYFSEYLLNK